jgi:hypothetical protein
MSPREAMATPLGVHSVSKPRGTRCNSWKAGADTLAANHSSSTAIALQLALDFPDAVHTLALMDPARHPQPSCKRRSLTRS